MRVYFTMKTILVRFMAMAAFAVSCYGDTVSIFDNPLSIVGNSYGFTAHEGKQEIFQHFSLTSASTINQVGWAGQFTDGAGGTNQSHGGFNIFLFRDNQKRLPADRCDPIFITRDGLPDYRALSSFRDQQAWAVCTGVSDPLLGGDIKEWSTAVESVCLAAGDYWISICANIAEDGFFIWNHGQSDGEALTVYGSVSETGRSSVLVTDCFANQSTMSLSLGYCSVPDEGMSVWLVLFAFGALIVGRGRRIII